MNNTLSTGKMMTVREVAETLGYEYDTIRKKVKELFPGLVSNGITTLLDQEQVTELKKHLVPRTLALKSEVDSASTDLEMAEKARDVFSWLTQKIEDEKSKRIEAERKNAILMHVAKVYTATEVAKELGMRSAQELNIELAKRGIQYFQNNTWVPKADYAELGYFNIKQEVRDDGVVIYHRKITQDGRAFILDFIGKR
jgi:phage antirepressor YoqD-like protein